MDKRTVGAAIAASLLLMAWLVVARYTSTGEGILSGVARLAVVGLLGYLAIQGRSWASLALEIWFGVSAAALVLGAIAVGGPGQTAVTLLFASVFAGAGYVMWKAWKFGIRSVSPS